MKSIPFLRIIIPYIFGIVVSIYLKIDFNFQFVIILNAVLLLLIILFQKINSAKYLLVVLLDLWMFFIGFMNTAYCEPKNNLNSVSITDHHEIIYLASLTEIPKLNGNFIKCPIRVSDVFKEDTLSETKGDLIAYFKKPIQLSDLEPGKTLCIKSKLIDVPQPKNPNEFNYAAYLRNNNVFYTTFINPEDFMVYDKTESNLNRIVEIGLKLKYEIVDRLRNSGLTNDAFTICSALLTGYDDEIDRSVIEAFSHSGTLHVLSVSGLHTGLIYVLLNYLINLFDPYNKKKRLRFLIVISVLWCFALITGFSAPVLRAVVMFSLMGFGKLFYRSTAGNQLNVLMLSAFILLSYNPYYILNIGFMLSYFAMIGIIALMPSFQNLMTVNNKILKHLIENASVSVAATITTMPITLYYFKQFPIWFFLCNLLVIPLSFIILILAFISLLQIPFLVDCINVLVELMIGFIRVFNQGKLTYIDCINFKIFDMLCLSLLVLGIYLVIKYRTFSYTLTSLIILVVWQGFSIMDSMHLKQSKFITVYNVKHKTRLVVKNKTEAMYNQFDSASFNYSLKPHFTMFSNSELKVKPFNFVKSKNQTLLILDSASFFPENNLSDVNTILLSNNFSLSEPDMQKFQKLSLVIADASNSQNINYRTENLCRKFGVLFYNTSVNGAYTMSLE